MKLCTTSEDQGEKKRTESLTGGRQEDKEGLTLEYAGCGQEEKAKAKKSTRDVRSTVNRHMQVSGFRPEMGHQGD